MLDPDNMNMRYNLACTWVVDLRDYEAALDLLEPFFARVGPEWLGWVESDPDLDAIREHPRLKAMIADASARLAQ